MPSPHQIIKNFANFGGLDLRTSDLIKDRVFATILTNAQQKETTSLEKRVGFKTLATTGGRFGRSKYAKIDSVGQPVFEDISFDSTPVKKSTGSITITYSGSATLVLFSIILDDTTRTFHAQLFVQDTNVLDYDLGTGIEEVTPKTLADLQTQINLVADFSCSISGSTTLRAALLPITLNAQITTSTPLTVTAYTWTALNTTVTNPLLGSNTNRGASDYENVSAVNLNQVLYCANGYNDLHKYDGQTFYKAGVPTSTTLAGTSLGGTGFTDTNIQYFYYYIQVDAQGNRVESGFSPASATISPANQTVTLTVANILAGSGFNTNCAVVNGNQVGVTTITVTNTPHTMKVGDTAYFFDGVSNTYVERSISAVTATTIAISGAAVNVSNLDVISNNLRIGIARTTAGGSLKYEILRGVNNVAVELPNNSFAATQTYADATGTRGGVIPEPIITPGLPPKGRYLAVHQNTLFIAGIFDAPNTVYGSDIDFIEGFDPLRRSFDVKTDNGDVVRGLGSNNEVLMIGCSNFTQGSIHVLSGVFQAFQYRVDLLSKNTGCVSHQTIHEIEGLLYFLSETGLYRMTSGQLPTEISLAIRPVFTRPIPNTNNMYSFKRAIGVVDDANQKYLLFLPSENTFDGTLVTGDDSRVWAFDYFRDAWYEWSNLDFAGGAAIIGDEFWFSGRRSDAISGVAESYSSRFLSNNAPEDYNDHYEPTSWEFGSVWEAYDNPGVFKLFLRTKLLSLEPNQSNTFQLDFASEINYIANASVTTASVILGSGNLGYGLSAYGVDPYGDPASPQEPIVKMAGVKAKSCRFRVANTEISENVVLSGYEMEVGLGYRGGSLKD